MQGAPQVDGQQVAAYTLIQVCNGRPEVEPRFFKRIPVAARGYHQGGGVDGFARKHHVAHRFF